MRKLVYLLAVAYLALAAVYVSEGGDVVYYSTLEGFGALNGLGQRLWHVGEYLLPSIKKLVDAGVVVAMTSQTLYGRVNLFVYRRGRELLSLGVVPLEDMLPEAAYAKMSWALANFKQEEVPRVLATPVAYDISPRSDPLTFGAL